MSGASSAAPRSSAEMEHIAPASSTAALAGSPKEKDGIEALRALNTREEPAKKEVQPKRHPDGRYELTEEAGYRHTGFAFPSWKKWWIITTIFMVQLSMNWNAAIYGSAIPSLKGEFGVDDFLVRIGQMVFLVAYAFGCELWAPWSEELGRKWVLQGSLLFVNLWQIGCALSSNFTSVLIFRGLGGLSSAGGSVTLGMVADMWEPNEHQHALNYVVLSSVCRSVIAPIFGGFITTYLSWQWVFWISLIFGAVAQIMHLFTPETRSDVMLDRRAQYLRKSGEHTNIYGPMEIRGAFWERVSFKEVMETIWLPFKFMITEPIVTFLSLLSGFSDALIFTGLDSFPLVLSKWDFSVIQVGLAFISLLIGYLIAYGMFFRVYKKDIEDLKDESKTFKPERRLWLLLYTVLLEPIGLFILGWTALGPPIHWTGPLFAIALIGVANFAIYMATIDYMVAAYGPRAASATGGNGFCRDLLAGIAALYARPLYSNILPGTKWTLSVPSFILTGIAILLCIPVYVFYVKGEWFRKRSPYASSLEKDREGKRGEREEAIKESRSASPIGSRMASRAASRAVSRRASLDDVRAEGEKEPPSPSVMEKEKEGSSFHA